MKPLDTTENAPWKQRYRATSVRWSQIAAQNSARGVVCSDRSGAFQLYAWEVETGQLRQLTDRPTGTVSGEISADGSAIIYHQDMKGNELGHFVSVPFEGGTETNLTPDFDPYPSWLFAENKLGTHQGFITTDQEGFKLHVRHGDGDLQLIYHQPEQPMFGPTFSCDGTLLAIDSSQRTGTIDTTIMVFDTITWRPIGELWDGEGASTMYHSFSPVAGDARLLGTSSQSGFTRPLIWNPITAERISLELDEIEGDLFAWGWSADGERILLNQLYQARDQFYLYEIATGRITKLNHPAGSFEAGYFTAEGEIIANWQDGTQPSQVVKLDGETGELLDVLLKAEEVPESQPWRSVKFTGAHDEAVQAWLTTPQGAGPFPTILHTHGGPTASMKNVFSAEAQAWVDHGFAYLSVNYHGSTTFGKAFEKSILGNLGDLEVEDMVAAYQWLVENGIAIAEQVLLTGRSYGGYLTLQALGKRPEFWAGGMAQVAIADWTLMYEDMAENIRSYQRALFGGAPAEVPEAMRKSSPITYAEAIQVPILVIQGEHDARCPARQMHAYEDKLVSLGKPIELVWFDAGHGSYAQEEAIDHQRLKMEFAYRILQEA